MKTDTAGAVHPTHYAEDLVVGSVHRLGEYRVTRDDIIEYASQWDPQPFHTDEAFAAEGFFGGVIASGMHSLAIYQRLAVLGAYRHWWVIAGRKLQDIRFLAPVTPGMTLTAELVIDDITFAREDRAVLSSSGRLLGDGVPVLSLSTEAWIHRRPRTDGVSQQSHRTSP